MAAITMPYGTDDIKKASGEERDLRENVRCQIDLGVSAAASTEPGDASLEETARRALREHCRVDIAPTLWTREGQSRLRKNLGVDIPLQFWDCDTKVFVIIMPDDAISFTRDDGILCYESAAIEQRRESAAGARSSQDPVKVKTPAGSQDGAKSVGDWKLCQDEFKHLGRLPKPWIFIRSSRDKDTVYYLNTQTHATQTERPLPAGWTKHTSKSTGKTYYFHAQKRRSMFEIPPPE